MQTEALQRVCERLMFTFTAFRTPTVRSTRVANARLAALRTSHCSAAMPTSATSMPAACARHQRIEAPAGLWCAADRWTGAVCLALILLLRGLALRSCARLRMPHPQAVQTGVFCMCGREPQCRQQLPHVLTMCLR